MALARHPNITVKFSSLFSRFSEPYPLPSLRPLVERVVGSFGADRCMFSSDGSVQVHGQPCSYRQWIDLFTDAADFLSESDLALLMGGAVSRWLDWPPLD
jgi:predicted TIM-barrel fold metal-dependent hydrolase